jgi:mono/diheme cytochrome c family protein
MRTGVLWALLVVTAASPGALAAEALSNEATQGQAILRNACGQCHGTETTGASPNAEAPPFREVAKLYPPEDLGETLAEGILTGHEEMPEYVFDPDAIGDIIAYLDWLAAQ